MGNLNVEANVTGPDKIEVRLVREDYLGVSNTFRFIFEICFGVACTVFGNMLSYKKINDIPFIYWFILIFMVIICLILLYFSITNFKKSRALT